MNTLAPNVDAAPAVGTPEWRLLIATARLELDDHWAAEFRQVLGHKLDWETVITQSLIHGTAGLLLRHLAAAPDYIEIPAEVMERLRAIHLRLTASGMQMLAQFHLFAWDLGEAGVPTIVLKGAALAERLYGDVGLRPMSDIDLIIREADWPEICKVLKKFNYSSVEQELGPLPPKLTKYDIQTHVQFVSPANTCLEFQFDLFTLGIGMFDMPGVWRRSREAGTANPGVRFLSPEDELLHLLVHANRHGCTRLKWLVDIAESLRQNGVINWDLLEDIARREKVTVIVHQTLMHVERLLGVKLVDAAILERFAPARYQGLAWNLLWPRQQLDEFRGRTEDGVCYYCYRPASGWNLLNFALMGRVRDKMIYQARWIVPSLDWMAQTFDQPKSLRLLRYYPMRLRERNRKKLPVEFEK